MQKKSPMDRAICESPYKLCCATVQLGAGQSISCTLTCCTAPVKHQGVDPPFSYGCQRFYYFPAITPLVILRLG